MLDVGDADVVARHFYFLFGFCTRNQNVEMITCETLPLQMDWKRSQLLQINEVKVEKNRQLGCEAELLPSSSEGNVHVRF